MATYTFDVHLKKLVLYIVQVGTSGIFFIHIVFLDDNNRIVGGVARQVDGGVHKTGSGHQLSNLRIQRIGGGVHKTKFRWGVHKPVLVSAVQSIDTKGRLGAFIKQRIDWVVINQFQYQLFNLLIQRVDWGVHKTKVRLGGHKPVLVSAVQSINTKGRLGGGVHKRF